VSEHTGLRSASEGLRDRLQASFLADPPLAVLFGGAHVVSLATPREMREAPAQLGVSVWLYKIDRDEFLANRPPERITPTTVRRTPIPVDLHYLVTPLAADAETEQMILGRVLQTLHDDPVFPVDAARPDVTETLRVTLENLDLESISRVWNALAEPYQLCVSYLVQVVGIRSTREATRARVLERDAEFTQILEVLG
jgi:hypothetical protein